MEESYHFVNEGLPDFVGENPMEWILTAERFFVEQQIYPSDRVQWAFMRMEGVAMLWFHSWCMENLDADWETFAIALVRRFGKRNYGVVVEEKLTEEDESRDLSEKRSKVEPNESTTEFDVAAKTMEADRTRVVVNTLPPSGSPVKKFPKPKPPDRDASWYEGAISTKPPSNPSESRDSDQLAPTIPRREPPPKPPDDESPPKPPLATPPGTISPKLKPPVRNSLFRLPPPRPPDTGSHTTTLPRLGMVFPQPPKPPEPPDTVGNNRISASYRSDKVRLVVVVGKDLEKLRVNWVMCKSGHILTLLDQTHHNLSRWEKRIKTWARLEPLKKAQNKLCLLSNSCVHKMHVTHGLLPLNSIRIRTRWKSKVK
jgi:hypothetical protein